MLLTLGIISLIIIRVVLLVHYILSKALNACPQLLKMQANDLPKNRTSEKEQRK